MWIKITAIFPYADYKYNKCSDRKRSIVEKKNTRKIFSIEFENDWEFVELSMVLTDCMSYCCLNQSNKFSIYFRYKSDSFRIVFFFSSFCQVLLFIVHKLVCLKPHLNSHNMIYHGYGFYLKIFPQKTFCSILYGWLKSWYLK